jgi:hypothetical protein
MCKTVWKECQGYDPNHGMTEMNNSVDKKMAGCPQPALEVCNSDDNDDSLFSIYGICL